jgi:hypothetical protein
MAKRKSAKKTQAAGVQRTKDGVEPMVVKLAERLGSLLGRVQSRVKKPVTAKPSKAKSTPAAKKRSGGGVGASGRRHGQEPPQELFDPLLGKPMGKQIAQKKVRPRRGRG